MVRFAPRMSRNLGDRCSLGGSESREQFLIVSVNPHIERDSESAPGRIRTSDSRFRNAPPYFLSRPILLVKSAYLCGFRCLLRCSSPALSGSVLARLQYGCSKRP